MRKPLKIFFIVAVIAVLAYKSVYIKKLDEVKNAATHSFDAAGFAKSLWNQKMPPRLDSAIALSALIKNLGSNPVKAFDKYSNAIAIGNYRYSLVNATGTVTQVNEDDVKLDVPDNGTYLKVTIETEFIYGNAIRDACGQVNIKDFSNTADLNDISRELNSMARKLVARPFKMTVKSGDKVQVTAAVTLNREHLNFNDLELHPLRIQILP